MYLRELEEVTLSDVADRLDDGGLTMRVDTAEITPHFGDDANTITLGEIELPMTPSGLSALAGYADIPEPFFNRMTDTIQDTLLTTLLPTKGAALVRYNDLGIIEVRNPDSALIDPRQLVEVAVRVIDKEAPVVNYWRNPSEFRLDVIVPDGHANIHGDKRVGDLTKAGLRMGQDIKHGHAPWSSLLMYRLACTNGMEHAEVGEKVDARGSTVEEFLEEFSEQCERQFRRAEHIINAFYEMRNTPVPNRELTIERIASEHRLPDRTMTTLLRAARGDDMPDDGAVSMFDVVNLVTNHANVPGTRDGAALSLQRVGGAVINDHAARCGHCLAKLN